MRIAILNSGHMDYGGTERVVAYQARGLHERGYEVAIFTPVNNPKVFREVVPSNVFLKPWWHTLPAPILKRTINRLLHFWFGGKGFGKFDFLIAHNQPGPYVAHKNKKKFHKPYLAYIHAPWRRLYPREVDLTSGWASDYRERLMFLRKGYWYKIDRESILDADGHLTNGQRIREEVEEVYGVKARVCYPGIEYEKYSHFPEEEVEKTVEKYDVDECSLLVVGRHAPQKRLEWIPSILSHVEKDFPKVKVIVTGRPNKVITPKLVHEAKRLGVVDKVKMVGSVPEDELISLYHSCPILLYSAVSEDFGLPPIEAMACGCVPVAWDEGAGPCETIVDGKTGLLAKPYDLKDFSEKVVRLMMDSSGREALAEKGMIYAEKFDWSLHLNILEEEIDKIVG